MKREEVRESCVRRSFIIVALLILCFNGKAIGNCSRHEELRTAYKVLIRSSLGKCLTLKALLSSAQHFSGGSHLSV
jgi:hypothetical protein